MLGFCNAGRCFRESPLWRKWYTLEVIHLWLFDVPLWIVHVVMLRLWIWMSWGKEISIQSTWQTCEARDDEGRLHVPCKGFRGWQQSPIALNIVGILRIFRKEWRAAFWYCTTPGQKHSDFNTPLHCTWWKALTQRIEVFDWTWPRCLAQAKTLSGPQVEEEQASSLLRKEVKRTVGSCSGVSGRIASRDSEKKSQGNMHCTNSHVRESLHIKTVEVWSGGVVSDNRLMVCETHPLTLSETGLLIATTLSMWPVQSLGIECGQWISRNLGLIRFREGKL